MLTEIIIVKYNIPAFEALCLEAVARHTYAKHHVTAYQNKKGVGLSTVWNKLIDRSDADFICLLNNDTVVTKFWLARMLDIFEDEENVGAVTPASNVVGASMSVNIDFKASSRNLLEINHFGQNRWCDWPSEVELRNREGLSGFCMLFPKMVWEESGGFNEDFHFYYEDAEWSKRIHREHGYNLMWAKGVYVHHYGSLSMKQATTDGEIDRIAEEIKSREMYARMQAED